jgi:hypothetical protein
MNDIAIIIFWIHCQNAGTTQMDELEEESQGLWKLIASEAEMYIVI